jgi:hypothetical protein
MAPRPKSATLDVARDPNGLRPRVRTATQTTQNRRSSASVWVVALEMPLCRTMLGANRMSPLLFPTTIPLVARLVATAKVQETVPLALVQVQCLSLPHSWHVSSYSRFLLILFLSCCEVVFGSSPAEITDFIWHGGIPCFRNTPARQPLFFMFKPISSTKGKLSAT